MIVVDASVVANALVDADQPGETARSWLASDDPCVPDVADVETLSVLRGHWLAGGLTDVVFESAVSDLASLPLRRHATRGLGVRIGELRHNVTAYDAAYVALAERLDCALITADAPLTRASGPRCPVHLAQAPS